MGDSTGKLRYEYRGMEIKVFHNSGKWDYSIPKITTEGYKSKQNLYETKARALEAAQREIDSHQ